MRYRPTRRGNPSSAWTFPACRSQRSTGVGPFPLSFVRDQGRRGNGQPLEPFNQSLDLGSLRKRRVPAGAQGIDQVVARLHGGEPVQAAGAMFEVYFEPFEIGRAAPPQEEFLELRRHGARRVHGRASSVGQRTRGWAANRPCSLYGPSRLNLTRKPGLIPGNRPAPGASGSRRGPLRRRRRRD